MDALSACLADVDHIAQRLFNCLKPHVGDLKWVLEHKVVKLAPWVSRNDIAGELLLEVPARRCLVRNIAENAPEVL